MSNTPQPASFNLRALPLPVKVVASVFLMAVGIGYTSAMVQLHMQDSKSGEPMPTMADVIRKYTGKKKFDPNDPPPAPASRLEALVMSDIVDISGQTMAGAFFHLDRAKGELKFNNAIRNQLPERVEEIKAERKGEQTALKLWINAKEEERKAAYEADKFIPPAGKLPKTLTPALMSGNAVKIKSIIEHRCLTCHTKDSKESKAEDIPLDTYDGLVKHMKVEAPAVKNGWVKVEEPISTTKLTQSTHAHLLSFAVLFSLTGLIFACSSYPTWVRCILGPWVVLAVVADVSLWWLARLCDDYGPDFAQGIIYTGAVAGVGLGLQITLSLFNMYGPKGKVVMALLFLLGAGIAGLVWVNVIAPKLPGNGNGGPNPNPIPIPNPPVKPEDKNGTPLTPEARKKQILESWEDLKSPDAAKKQAAQQTLDKLVGEALRKQIEEAQKGMQSDKQEVRAAAQKELQELKVKCGIADAVAQKFNVATFERLLNSMRTAGAIPIMEPAPIERLLLFPVKGPDGKFLGRDEMDQIPFRGDDEGNMARAFFDKSDAAYRAALNGPKEKLDKLHTERDGEREALIAWAGSADATRKAAYEKDSFVLPLWLADDPITPEYAKDGKVRIKTLINDRCARCHQPGAKQEEYPLTTYDEIRKYLNPPLPALPAMKDK